MKLIFSTSSKEDVINEISKLLGEEAETIVDNFIKNTGIDLKYNK